MKLLKTILGTTGTLIEIGLTWLYVIVRFVLITGLVWLMCILSGSACGIVYGLARFGFTMATRFITSIFGS